MLTVMRPNASRKLRTEAKVKLSSLRRHNDHKSERTRLIEALSDLHNLLEEYAPAWYTEEHHRRAESALHRAKE
jgi:hypothetical protein